jgi:hypothetical protein
MSPSSPITDLCPWHFVHLVWGFSTSGGASLDKASNHPHIPDKPGGWLSTPSSSLGGVTQVHAGGTQGPRKGAPKPPLTERTFYLTLRPPAPLIAGFGIGVLDWPPLKVIVKTAWQYPNTGVTVTEIQLGISQDPPQLFMIQIGRAGLSAGNRNCAESCDCSLSWRPALVLLPGCVIIVCKYWQFRTNSANPGSARSARFL